MELSDRERELILAALNLMVKQASNSLQAANEILPLALKVQTADVEKNDKTEDII